MERTRPRPLLRWRLSSLLRPSSCSLSSSVQEPIFLSSSRRHLPLSRRLAENGSLYHANTELDGLTCPPASPASPTRRDHRHKKGKPKKLISNSYGFTSSSSDALFSSEDDPQREEEREMFLSSRSFSSDSSEFYYRRKRDSCRGRRHRRRGCSVSSVSAGGFLPLVSMEEEREKGPGGFAVEKESSDPYADFRSSMLEMIMERQIFGKRELEALLRSYIALNSSRHHEVIVKVFRDICQALFGR